MSWMKLLNWEKRAKQIRGENALSHFILMFIRAAASFIFSGTSAKIMGGGGGLESSNQSSALLSDPIRRGLI